MRARYGWLVGFVLALAMPGAWAAGGRIVFTGAVVAPTCAVDTTASTTTRAPAVPADTRTTCGQTTAVIGSSYVSRTMALDTAAAAGDHLLTYFVERQLAAAGGKVTTRLVVRTYQ